MTYISMFRLHKPQQLRDMGFDHTSIVFDSYVEFRIVYEAKIARTGSIVVHKSDNYGNDTIFVFASKADAKKFIKEMKGDYDIENGGAPFGYQRNPARAKERIEKEIRAERQEQMNELIGFCF